MYIPIGILVLLALVFLSFDYFLVLLTIFVFGWLLIYMWPLALILLILFVVGIMLDKLNIIIEKATIFSMEPRRLTCLMPAAFAGLTV